MANAQAAEQTSKTGSEPKSLTDVLDALVDNTEGDTVTFDDLLATLDNRSYGPLLLIPSLIALGPTGAIPGMSILTGTLIILIATQMLFKHGQPWVPERIRRFEFSRSKLKSAVETSRPYAKSIQRWIGPRATWLTSKPWSYAIPIISILFALTMYPLALIPFGVAIPSFALTLMSLGLTLKDGVLVAIGYAVGLAAAVIAMQMF